MNHIYEILLAIAIVLPFISFWVLVFAGPKLGKPKAGWFAVVLGMGLPCVLATIVLVGWGLFETPESRAELTANAYRFEWATLGSIPLTIGVKLDSLTVAMFFMVTFVAGNIFVFSVGYMAGHSDEVDHQCKYWRFFAYLSLFGFSMLGLVVASSLLFLFIFWELVGLCSYLLIGYYFDRAYASRAGMKAFITNRVGDFGFIAGLMMVVTFFGTFDLDQAAVTFERSAQLAARDVPGVAPLGEQTTAFATAYLADASPELKAEIEKNAAVGKQLFTSRFTLFGVGLATLMGIGLFCGAMGKSAQFPLHVWLPDAMAGPTPVSALIHAATMVAAGVYLVARVFRLLTPEAQMFIATIGCITLTAMALIAIVQTDIKKCLAYSTLSQLGYMIFGMGIGAWTAALFHLITHAFFKAMLFLGSGQVIEGCHHEQDMRKMGGLRKKMPVTCWTFFVGVLAIAGAGIPGMHIGLGGYFSKDEILAVGFDRMDNWHGFGEHATDEHAAMDVAASDAGVALASFSPNPQDHESGHEATSQSHDESKTDVSEYEIAGSDYLIAFAPRSDEAGEDPEGEHDMAHAGLGSTEAAHGGRHGSTLKNPVAAGTKPLPPWMFWLAIATAYVTPFYMFRCWWMTFMGKPRDHHVHDHAHESPLMYLPLVVLAIGTGVASYWIFPDLIRGESAAATDAAMVVAVDGVAHDSTDAVLAMDHSNDPHAALVTLVGFAFVIGFAVAWVVYRNGLDLAERIRRTPPFSIIHLVLEKKYFFDEVYDFVCVGGCVMVARLSRFFDTYVVDSAFNLMAAVTERLANFSGRVLDAEGVDGFFHGIRESVYDLAAALRTPQSGRIRRYVVLSVGVAALAVIGLMAYPWIIDAVGVRPRGEGFEFHPGAGEWLAWTIVGAGILVGLIVIHRLTSWGERMFARRRSSTGDPTTW